MKYWLLLLQLDLTNAYETFFLEGMLYVMVPRHDSQTGPFDRATAVFQGTWMC
jgi:hypothetical protein